MVPLPSSSKIKSQNNLFKIENWHEHLPGQIEIALNAYNNMVKADLRVCTDCGCVFNREIGLKAISQCPACGSESREPLEM